MDRRYHLKNIRTLLTEGFDDEELRRLCYDVSDFRPVYDQLARNSGKAEIIDRLLEYADRTLQIETLLTLAKEHNPARYEEHQPYEITNLTTKPGSVPEESTDSKDNGGNFPKGTSENQIKPTKINDQKGTYSESQPVVPPIRNEPPKGEGVPPRTNGKEVESKPPRFQEYFPQYTSRVWLSSFAISILLNTIAYFFLLSLGVNIALCLMLVSILASTIFVAAIINALKEPDLPIQGYEYIDNVSEIKNAVKEFRDAFDSYKAEPILVNLPFSKEPISVRYFGKLDMWAHFDDEVKHGERIFRNMFGLGRPTKDPRYYSLNLGYEAIDGNNTKANKRLHSGFVKLKRVDQELFFLIHRDDIREKYEGGIWITTEDGQTLLLIAQLGKDNIPKQVAKFVKKVKQINITESRTRKR